jgi:predicted deacetylase
MLPYPKRAKYLLRFDDLSPSMNWNVWAKIEEALVRRRIQPLLAVVPDNRDPTLQVGAPVENFWQRVKGWHARGWTVCLHGFQHKYVTEHTGIVTTKTKSEFAGLPARDQEDKLRRGVEIFARQGIHPSVWIAPNHSFDSTTVALLPRFGIRIISDGRFRFPFVCSHQMFWVPQQLFQFRPAPAGIWTVCYHHNQWTPSMLSQFHRDLERYSEDIWPLEKVVETWRGRRSRGSSWLCKQPRLSSLFMRGQLKAWQWCRPKRQCGPPRSESPIPMAGQIISEQ